MYLRTVAEDEEREEDDAGDYWPHEESTRTQTELLL
tara:strand:- start:406 stop:513 length:108 start_codon:yes stop_codon:yes gene_type:complete